MQQAIEELEKALEHLVKARAELDREPAPTFAFTIGYNTLRAANLTRQSLKLFKQQEKEEYGHPNR